MDVAMYRPCVTHQYNRHMQCCYFNKTGNVRITYIEGRSCNHCCSGKATSITYAECVCVCVCSLRHLACNVHAHIFICGLARSTNFFLLYLINGTILEKKKSCWIQNVFDILYNLCLKYFLF